MQKQQIPLKNSLFLLLAAVIWGIAFVAQSVGMDYVGGFTFNAVRSLIGSAVLVPLILIPGQKNSDNSEISEAAASTTSGIQKRKDLIIGGISCGICLCLASNFQQFGIKYTTVGKAGFITACYIVIVPIIGLFLGKKCSKFIWAAVAMALIGLYLLCITDGFSIGKGDLLVLVCAFLFSIHILVIDHFSPKADGVKLSCIQFLTCGDPVCHPCPDPGTSPGFLYSGSMAAHPLCRCHVLRCCLYSAGHRSEEHEPHCGIPDPQYGVLHLRTCRMDHPWTAAKRKRNPWMCDHVCSYHLAQLLRRIPPRYKTAYASYIKTGAVQLFHCIAPVFMNLFYSTLPTFLWKCSFIFAKLSSLRSCSNLHASSLAISGSTPRYSSILLNTVCLS